jgi:NADP-dependent 3-hydroxy acid dehydrogenase YdfG
MYAVITGGTKGIGRSIIAELASVCQLMVTCSRNDRDLELLVSEYRPGLIIGYKTDLSISAERHNFVNQVLKHGVPDVLINNAGVFLQDNLTEIFPGNNFEQMLQLNFYSTMEPTQMLLPHLISKASGHIINVCSVAGTQLYMDSASYTMAKTLQLTYSRMLREYLKDKGVKVTSLIPGATLTDSWAGVDLPQNRIIDPDDIARVVKMCISLGESANIEEIVVRPSKGDL